MGQSFGPCYLPAIGLHLLEDALGLRVALDLLDHFEDGVLFVDLSAAADSELVASGSARSPTAAVRGKRTPSGSR